MTLGVMVLGIGLLLMLVGLCWALPWGRERRRTPGWVLVGAGLIMVAALIPPFGSFLARFVLWGMTLVAIGSAVAMITSIRPVYSALWFGMSVLGTAGLLLYHGAEFVAMALIVIYVGAILVVFLFVIMLDEPRGQSGFNRRSWEPFVASLAGVLLIGLVTGAALEGVGHSGEGGTSQMSINLSEKMPEEFAPTRTVELGKELFGSFPLAVEGLGILLLLALVGTAVIIWRPLEPLRDFNEKGEVERLANTSFNTGEVVQGKMEL